MELTKDIRRILGMMQEAINDAKPHEAIAAGSYWLVTESAHLFDNLSDTLSALNKCGLLRYHWNSCISASVEWSKSLTGRDIQDILDGKCLLKELMPIEQAIDTIDKVVGFDDDSTAVGEAWRVIKQALES